MMPAPRSTWDRWATEAPIVVDVRPSQTASDITKLLGSYPPPATLAPPWPWDIICEVRTLREAWGAALKRSNLADDAPPTAELVRAVLLLEAILARQAELARWIS
jgi:hypothetical protein